MTGGAQSFVPGGDVSGDWWVLFGAPALSRLVAASLADNVSLQAASARLTAAQETALAARGSLFPALDLGFSPARQKQSAAQTGAAGGTTYSLYTAGAQVSYTFDMWGAERRGVEEAAARAEQQRFAYEGALNMLAANTATTAITAAALAAEIGAQQSIIAAERDTLARVRAQFEAGAATGTDVATQEAALAASETALPPLRASLARARDTLAANIGRTPAQADLPRLSLDDIHLPASVPVSLPSDLVARRPDLRAAEADLHAATAALGVARANRLPSITLNAAIGSAPGRIEDLFAPGAGTWSLGAQLLAPVFHGGTLLHTERAADATARAAALAWRDTAIGAFRDVADALSALDFDAQALAASQNAAAAADKSLRLATVQYDAGSATYLAVLTAQSQAQIARIALVRARAARLTDTVALYVALGGGWWHRTDIPPAAPVTWKDLLP